MDNRSIVNKVIRTISSFFNRKLGEKKKPFLTSKLLLPVIYSFAFNLLVGFCLFCAFCVTEIFLEKKKKCPVNFIYYTTDVSPPQPLNGDISPSNHVCVDLFLFVRSSFYMSDPIFIFVHSFLFMIICECIFHYNHL